MPRFAQVTSVYDGPAEDCQALAVVAFAEGVDSSFAADRITLTCTYLYKDGESTGEEAEAAIYSLEQLHREAVDLGLRYVSITYSPPVGPAPPVRSPQIPAANANTDRQRWHLRRRRLSTARVRSSRR